jgi:hypothetical protein
VGLAAGFFFSVQLVRCLRANVRPMNFLPQFVSLILVVSDVKAVMITSGLQLLQKEKLNYSFRFGADSTECYDRYIYLLWL